MTGKGGVVGAPSSPSSSTIFAVLTPTRSVNSNSFSTSTLPGRFSTARSNSQSPSFPGVRIPGRGLPSLEIPVDCVDNDREGPLGAVTGMRRFRVDVCNLPGS